MRQKIRTTVTTVAIIAAAGLLGTSAGQALAGQSAGPRDAPVEGVISSGADNPWSQLRYEGSYEVETYDGLGGTVRSASVSVLGTVSDVRPGEVLIDSDGTEEMRYQSVVVSVSVDEVLSGAIGADSASIDVEFGPYAEEDLAENNFDELVGQQSIYLLRLKGEGVPREGIAENPELMQRSVYRVVNSTGLLDDADGSVEAPLAEEEGFVADLEGEPFEEVVEEVDAQG